MRMTLIIAFVFSLIIPSYIHGGEPAGIVLATVQQAVKRQERMLELIETNPSEFLRLAMTKESRSKLALQVQALIEREITVTGKLEILHEDWPDGARYYWFVKNGSQTYSLYMAGQPGEFYSGLNVKVKGIGFDDKIAVYPSDIIRLTAPAVLPNTFGQQKTIVILVNFQDTPIQPHTLDFARDVVFTGAKSVSNYLLENSYQQTSLTGDVFGWFTIAQDSTICDLAGIESKAIQAFTATGGNISGYNRRVYAFPRNVCPWAGAAMVGGSPSRAWINDNMNLRVVAHELGHGFGLLHSHGLECGTVSLADNCEFIEYGDTQDVMGSSVYHFNAFQKELLGWLNYGSSPPIRTVNQVGANSIGVYEKVDQNPKALKFVRLVDPVTRTKTWYYLETRRPIGFDSGYSTNPNVSNGVIVRTGTDGNRNSSFLLDMTPLTLSWADPALEKGILFVDPKTSLSLSVVSVDADGAVVAIAFNSAPMPPGGVSVQ